MAEKIEFTREQLRAIDNRDGTILVSAAAGSGKTAVLVERVIRRITDEEKPCPADSLLIVTFTKAAAAGMKRKLLRSLNERIADKPSAFLAEQRLLLNSAVIGTIDSFCNDLVRENFFSAGIRSDFRILSEGEELKLKEQTAEAVVGKCYSSGSEDFRALSGLIVSGGKDSDLSRIIVDIYDKVSAYPYPLKVLDGFVDAYLDESPAGSTPWGRAALDEVGRLAGYALRLIKKARDVAIDRGCLDVFEDVLADDESYYTAVADDCGFGYWNELYYRIKNHSYTAFPRKKSGVDPEAKNAVKACRDMAKDVFSGASSRVFLTKEEYESDRLDIVRAVTGLIGAVKLYAEELFAAKQGMNAYGFNDVEHFAFDILSEKREDGSFTKSDAARDLANSYSEIMVDEYQDTNELQDSIFSLLSTERGDLFMVGDVKQSIYRFRQAMPDIFLKKREDFGRFNGHDYPGTVVLTSNFRSRASVTAPVNYIFERVMSKAVGDVDYNEDERLNCGRTDTLPDDKPHTDEERAKEKDRFSTQFFICDKNSPVKEPEYVAEYIRDLILRGVYAPGDFCVITRNKDFEDYAEALKAAGIPFVYQEENDVGNNVETSVVLSVLRAVDDPLRDVELAAAMLSPAVGFTADELAAIRAGAPKGEFLYHTLRRRADEGDGKCADFLDTLEKIRYMETGSCAYEFLKRVYELTDIGAVVSALPQSEKRRENLNALLSIAASFDASGKSGLGSFLRYADRFTVSGADSEIFLDKTKVKICNAHKTKGLEFPVCILTDINKDAYRPNVSVVSYSRDLLYNVRGGGRVSGLGLKKKEKLSGKTLNTLQFAASELSNKRMDYSEGMRLLYVAATRAQERLVFFGTPTGKTADFLKKLTFAETDAGGRVDPDFLMTGGSMFFWAAAALAHHPSAAGTFTDYGLSPEPSFFEAPKPGSGFDLEFTVLDAQAEPEAAEEPEPEAKAEPSPALMSMIAERAAYSYPFAPLSGIYSKLQASDSGSGEVDFEHFASEVPSFARGSALSAADIGTLTHKLMQNLEFSRGLDLRAFLDRLVESGVMTREEIGAVDVGKVERFIGTELFDRICSASEVFREHQFAMRVPVTEAYPELDSRFADESVIVQGMIDLFFIEDGQAVIVDYKTDRRVTEKDLLDRHSDQLLIYARAVEKCTDHTVKDALIYSLELGKAVSVFRPSSE